MTTLPRVAERTQSPRRVLLVDDSAVARAALSRMLEGSGRYTVVATAAHAQAAVTALGYGVVDAILLDLDLPDTSGIEVLPALIAAGQGAPVLVVSGLAERGAAITIHALALGAADTLVKPAAGLDARFAADLVERLDALLSPQEPSVAAVVRGSRPASIPPFQAIAIGASTGGIHALTALIGALPADMTAPIFVTQHLPSAFTDVFRQLLTTSARRGCRIAAPGLVVEPGAVLAAPGDAHMMVYRYGSRVSVRLSTAPSRSGNLPSVDPMFATLAEAYGPGLLAVVLSGMGKDGLEGARAVAAAGGTVLAQDKESSVVWGMPGSVVEEGLTHAVLPPAELGRLIASTNRMQAA